MTVVEEPAEGELIEAVVVAVDVLVALRPAITIVTYLKGRKREKWKNSAITTQRKMLQFSERDISQPEAGVHKLCSQLGELKHYA